MASDVLARGAQEDIEDQRLRTVKPINFVIARRPCERKGHNLGSIPCGFPEMNRRLGNVALDQQKIRLCWMPHDLLHRRMVHQYGDCRVFLWGPDPNRGWHGVVFRGYKGAISTERDDRNASRGIRCLGGIIGQRRVCRLRSHSVCSTVSCIKLFLPYSDIG